MAYIYTYHNNRSIFLNEILESHGWKKAEEGQTAEFGMWSTHADGPRDSIIKLYELEKTNKMDNKRSFYLHLLERGITNNVPETFLSWEDVLKHCDKNGIDSNRLWYLKHANSSEGKHVWCYNDINHLKTYATKPKMMDNYVVQLEVPRMKLIVGYKVTFRVYALIWEGRLYIYRRYVGKIHSRPYDTSLLESDRHIECVVANGKCLPFEGSKWEYDDIYFPTMKHVTRQVVGSFISELVDDPSEHKNRYSLLGLDYIVDQDLKPWLIEINTYPYLWDNNELFGEIKKNLLSDVYNFIIQPTLTDNPPQMGEFIRLN